VPGSHDCRPGGYPNAIAHAQEAQQVGTQGRTAAAALPDRSQPARLSRACQSGLPLSVFRRKIRNLLVKRLSLWPAVQTDSEKPLPLTLPSWLRAARSRKSRVRSRKWRENDSFDMQPATSDVAQDESIGVTMSVQQELAQLGYYHGPIDGIAGAETEHAIRWFQSVDHLPMTGQIDSATKQALRIG
jgi:Putative peptidoglycan binding domain